MVFPAPVWPTTAMVSPGSMRKLTSRSTQSFSRTRTRRGRTRWTGPSGNARGAAGDVMERRVQQLEHALTRRHRRLQDVVFFAQVLNGAKESQPVLEERDHHAERKMPWRMRNPPYATSDASASMLRNSTTGKNQP